MPLRASLNVIVLCLGFLIVSCGSDDSGDNSPAARVSWTYMVYMAADNDLSANAKEDVNEIEMVGSSGDVNVVVQAEFNHQTTLGVPSQTIRGRVVQDLDTGNLGAWYSQIGDKDMTDPATLTDFITWAAQNYPADRYALVLWSHATGWKASSEAFSPGKGIFIDRTSAGSSYLMPLTDLAEGILESGVFLDVVNLDACLMGMYEVAYELREAAAYLIASPEEYPVDGDPYDAILSELMGNPAMNAGELTLAITTKCREFYENSDSTMTKAAYSLAAVGQLHTDICALAEYLIDNMDAAEVDVIESARNSSIAYLYPENHDLGDFLDRLEAGTADAGLESIINDVKDSMNGVIFSREIYIDSEDPANPVKDSQGMAIYLPSRLQYQVSPGDLARYAGLSLNDTPGETWYDFLHEFVQWVP